ncbi:TerB family tellurite resistance protein [Palleronia caenipelagi]|uniref:TerB family tellurite resistance protein n=1 Tax=Palleronia caenipelagi TaxID=2489174 RepID=A0A547Q7T6_9RHOB|nr:TerB family tellurite resistance protein [Palleronia caenipelagi]TRD22457.1 TerB family tellurite resistance protein [Palleronia caenipelagi]
MLNDLLRRLTTPTPEPLGMSDARLALAALLVRVARADADYAATERARILKILSNRYNLDALKSEALLCEAESIEADAPDTVRFTRAIKDAVPYEDRIGVIEALWQVALADGNRDAEEDALLRMVAPMLGVNDRESNLARQRVAPKG